MTSAATCRRGVCDKPASDRTVMLLSPEGLDNRACGPYCDECTDLLIRLLRPAYTGGGPCFEVREAVEQRA